MNTAAPVIQTSGAVGPDQLYISREADEQLYALLLENEFCCVLDPRQSGKSSLKVRTMLRLLAAGIDVVSVDVSDVVVHATDDRTFFRSVSEMMAERLDLMEVHAAAWAAPETTISGWMKFLAGAHEAIRRPAVVFIDEIDRALVGSEGKLRLDDLFTSIRSVYNKRAEDPTWRRLTFCIVGVARRQDLIANDQSTPYNIGKDVRLGPFTREQLGSVVPLLAERHGNPEAMLDRILYWTDGHPYPTMVMLDACRLSAPADAEPAALVDRLLQQRFIDQEDEHLTDMERRMRNARARLPTIVDLYRRVVEFGKVPYQGQDPVHDTLRLTGLVSRRGITGAELVPRSRLVLRLYGREWVEAQAGRRPFAELIADWLERGRPVGLLPRGERLRDLIDWEAHAKDVSPEESEFVRDALKNEGDIARKDREAERKQKRVAILFGVIAFVAMIVAAVLGYFQWRTAISEVRAREAAEAASARADAQSQLASSERDAAQGAMASADEQRMQAEAAWRQAQTERGRAQQSEAEARSAAAAEAVARAAEAKQAALANDAKARAEEAERGEREKAVKLSETLDELRRERDARTMTQVSLETRFPTMSLHSLAMVVEAAGARCQSNVLDWTTSQALSAATASVQGLTLWRAHRSAEEPLILAQSAGRGGIAGDATSVGRWVLDVPGNMPVLRELGPYVPGTMGLFAVVDEPARRRTLLSTFPNAEGPVGLDLLGRRVAMSDGSRLRLTDAWYATEIETADLDSGAKIVGFLRDGLGVALSVAQHREESSFDGIWVIGAAQAAVEWALPSPGAVRLLPHAKQTRMSVGWPDGRALNLEDDGPHYVAAANDLPPLENTWSGGFRHAESGVPLTVRDGDSDQRVEITEAGPYAVSSALLHSRGGVIAGLVDGRLIVWPVGSVHSTWISPVESLREHGAVRVIRPNPADEDWIAVGTDRGGVEIWRFDGGALAGPAAIFGTAGVAVQDVAWAGDNLVALRIDGVADAFPLTPAGRITQACRWLGWTASTWYASIPEEIKWEAVCAAPPAECMLAGGGR